MRRGPRLPPEQLAPSLLSLPEPPDLFDWRTVFGNDRPVELEVGFGKGLFLVRAGQASPETNFLGIEVVRKYQLFTATRLAKRSLHNVRLVLADARVFLRDGVASASLQALHVYYPDPWWKKRHHKRRVFTPEFAEQCVRVLRPGGQLLLATDVPDYAEMVRQTVAGCPALRELPPPEEHAPAHDMDYLTNFERKFRRQGKPIHRMRFEKA